MVYTENVISHAIKIYVQCFAESLKVVMLYLNKRWQ